MLATERTPLPAERTPLATSVVGVAAALVIAVVEWRRDVHQERRSDEHHPAEQHP